MKIGIATAFSSMLDFYSLTSVVMQQIKMILQAGHKPVLIVMDDFNWTVPADLNGLEIRKGIPAFHKIDYMSLEDMTPEHQALVPRISETLGAVVSDLDAVFTHDLLFTGWNLPIGMAVHNVATKYGPWLHWIHSVPAGRRDYWKLPDKSLLVYPNETNRILCAENFRTWREKILIVPHCCDIRDFAVTSPVAKELITRYDLLGADLIQVYPVPIDRADAKGVHHVIRMFGMLKDMGNVVRVVFPNAWCNVDKWRERVTGYYSLAESYGLSDREVIFTSVALGGSYEVGLPMSDIKDLELCGNLFICPTISETFGFSIAEAACMGSLLVLNEDLPMLAEICGGVGNAIWAKFSSNFYKTVHKDEEKYYRDICKIIMHHVNSNPLFKSKTFYRKQYRREAVWARLENAILAMKAGRSPDEQPAV